MHRSIDVHTRADSGNGVQRFPRRTGGGSCGTVVVRHWHDRHCHRINRVAICMSRQAQYAANRIDPTATRVVRGRVPSRLLAVKRAEMRAIAGLEEDAIVARYADVY